MEVKNLYLTLHFEIASEAKVIGNIIIENNIMIGNVAIVITDILDKSKV